MDPAKEKETVDAYMQQLAHPLKKEMEALRQIIRSADGRIGERIKWNAPSYYYKEDMVTFNPRAAEHVHLVFHHPQIESINSTLLKGDYKGRRMSYFRNMEEVAGAKKEITRVLKELISKIEAK